MSIFYQAIVVRVESVKSKVRQRRNKKERIRLKKK